MKNLFVVLFLLNTIGLFGQMKETKAIMEVASAVRHKDAFNYENKYTSDEEIVGTCVDYALFLIDRLGWDNAYFIGGWDGDYNDMRRGKWQVIEVEEFDENFSHPDRVWWNWLDINLVKIYTFDGSKAYTLKRINYQNYTSWLGIENHCWVEYLNSFIDVGVWDAGYEYEAVRYY